MSYLHENRDICKNYRKKFNQSGKKETKKDGKRFEGDKKLKKN